MFGLFFKQHHLLNLIILEVYVKICPKCANLKTDAAVAQNLIDELFSNFDCQMTVP